MTEADIIVDGRMRGEVVEGLIRAFDGFYVLPDVARRLGEVLRERLNGGAYDGITSGAALAETLTEHVREVTQDLHAGLIFGAGPRPLADARKDDMERFRHLGVAENFGFRRVEILPGSVGYVDIREFRDPAEAGDTAVAAMAFVANSSALIFDARGCRGGHAAMLDLLSTYLFEGRVHVNDFYWRTEDRTEQFWTLPYVPGRRYLAKPVYILTSRDTFSAGEGFAYSLQQLKRALIVGETTRGGAHPGDASMFQTINAHFIAAVPTGRAANPISESNWERVGVAPDVPVDRARALETAHRLALEKIIADGSKNTTALSKVLVEEAKAALAMTPTNEPPLRQ